MKLLRMALNGISYLAIFISLFALAIFVWVAIFGGIMQGVIVVIKQLSSMWHSNDDRIIVWIILAAIAWVGARLAWEKSRNR
jgi:hypothetical protein